MLQIAERRPILTGMGFFEWSFGVDTDMLNRCVMTGTLDDGPDALPPKGEVATKERNKFMSEVPGMSWSKLA